MLSTQEELRQSYMHWERSFPEHLTWRKGKASKDNSWWDIAATICLRYDIPAPLMIYLVPSHVNDRPEDAVMPISATLYRSEYLLNRTVANWRSAIGVVLKHLEPLHLIETGKELILPNSTLDAGRLVAGLTCRYFEAHLEVMSYALTRGEWQLDDEMSDMLAYQICQATQHPFLLLRVARSPRIRALAAVNACKLCETQPWHRAVWEGIASPHSLGNPTEMAGDPEIQRFFRDGVLQKSWPYQILNNEPLWQLNDETEPPVLRLSDIRLCDKTDLFLAGKLLQARRGQTC